MARKHCPACGGDAAQVFYEARNLPVHATQVCRTPEAARRLKRGDQVLAVCPDCGLVFNTVFAAELLDYSGEHEESQGFSPTFQSFARSLARDWVDRWGLKGEPVIEAGCGNRGEFLFHLAEAGVGLAYGIDPGLRLEAVTGRQGVGGERAMLARSRLSRSAAAVVCRHTLEHIETVSAFLETVVDAIDPVRCRALLFEVPDFERVLDQGAFWDFHYEHCSSFTALSLSALFRRFDLDVTVLRRVYGDQYLVIEADPLRRRSRPGEVVDIGSMQAHLDKCMAFAAAAQRRSGAIEEVLDRATRAGRDVVVWGGGAKGSVLLNTVRQSVRRVVDINPGLQGRYLAGSGLPIVAPAALRDDVPDTVMLMNPHYLAEVRSLLDDLGLNRVELIAV